MRLAEIGAYFFDSTTRKGIGLMIPCPLCVKEGKVAFDESREAHLLPVHLQNPLDGGGPPDTSWGVLETVNGVETYVKKGEHPRWQRTGSTLDELTLSPSINADAQDHGSHRGWHGFVQNGRVVGGGV